ncbi:MAG: DUF1273 domain-containing protein [Ruminococcus sp.]|nr:DUF1273 domain-containing protein [Ruminococcus sp.]
MKTCCFTGHRKINDKENLINIINNEIKTLISFGVTDFYAGGAIGWDMLCEQSVINHCDKKHPDIRLHLILPCTVTEQTLKWTEKQKSLYHKILKSADSIEYVSEKYFVGCMKKRNQQLVDLADCCFCYYNDKKSASGTGQTVRMAQRKGIKIINAKEL